MKIKRVEDAEDLGQEDDGSQGSSKMTDIMMVPPVLMTRLISATLKFEKTDRTLNGKALEIKTLSQFGGSPLKDFKPSRINQRNGSVSGQLTPAKRNHKSSVDTVLIDKPAGNYVEELEFRNSVTRHLNI